jgi:hypothetical protein
MKTPLFLLLFVAFSVQLQAQNTVVNDFYRDHKRAENTVSMMLPGLVLQLGLPILKVSAEDQVERDAMDLLKDVSSIKLLVGTEEDMPKRDRIRLLRDLSRSGYEPLVQVRSKDQQIDVIIREKDDLVRNLVVLIDGDEEVIFFSLKTRIHLDDLENIINEAMAESE